VSRWAAQTRAWRYDWSLTVTVMFRMGSHSETWRERCDFCAGPLFAIVRRRRVIICKAERNIAVRSGKGVPSTDDSTRGGNRYHVPLFPLFPLISPALFRFLFYCAPGEGNYLQNARILASYPATIHVEGKSRSTSRGLPKG
jgi:hypothetical protein